MKTKEYMLLAVILAAGVVAVLLPIIASGGLRQEFYDPDLTIPKAQENLLPSIFGMRWPVADSTSPPHITR